MNWELIGDILLATVPLLVIFPSMFALTTWVERKALARIQNRIGPNKVGVPPDSVRGQQVYSGLANRRQMVSKCCSRKTSSPPGPTGFFISSPRSST